MRATGSQGDLFHERGYPLHASSRRTCSSSTQRRWQTSELPVRLLHQPMAERTTGPQSTPSALYGPAVRHAWPLRRDSQRAPGRCLAAMTRAALLASRQKQREKVGTPYSRGTDSPMALLNHRPVWDHGCELQKQLHRRCFCGSHIACRPRGMLAVAPSSLRPAVHLPLASLSRRDSAPS